ncbi:sigma factor-like helix-turn-helix DNA-binding protein [Providencia rettgeri]|uniref:sigma factor-like helix-turn-helix DNA-binding protein n=1 Tax=Providencia TaxID=586 RepID=UPI001E3C08FA|nr:MULTISPECIES: sigma factor-like helix-turn-helix DNA-binding protein [Providencia]
MDIHVRFIQGQSIRKIARELGISRNTVKHHLQQQQMPTYTRRAPKQTKLAPFEPYLIQRIQLAKPDWISATVLFDELCQRGYQGGIAQLRRFVCQFKPIIAPEPPAQAVKKKLASLAQTGQLSMFETLSRSVPKSHV